MLRDEIGLGQHQPVGDRHLFDRFRLPLQRVGAVHRIDRGDHAGKREALGERIVAHHRMQDRCRVGKPARLDHHAVERRYRGFVAPAQDVGEGEHEVAADRAAQAAGLQRHEAFVARLDQVVVEADLAELVDDHRGAGERWALEQPSEQRGLAAAEKPGEHAHRDHGGTSAPLPKFVILAATARCAAGSPGDRDRRPGAPCAAGRRSR